MQEPFKPNLQMPSPTLGPSRYRTGARINMGIICIASFGTLFFILFGQKDRGEYVDDDGVLVKKWTFDIDPWALFVFGYLVVLNNLQQSYMEWPFLDKRPLILVVWTLFGISLSTIMLQAGMLTLMSEPGGTFYMAMLTRLPVWVFNYALGNRAWALTVRGPMHVVPHDCLKDKYVVITGCNTGIGFLTAIQLAEANGKIIFACRNKKKADDAIEQLLAKAPTVNRDNCIFMELDVGSMDKVRKFAEEYKEKGWPIDVLLCNAGVINAERTITKDGLDNTLTANCLGHFLLLELLVPVMRDYEQKGGLPRIVMVTSALAWDCPYYDWSNAVKATTPEEREAFARKPFSMFPCYAQSKYIQMLTMCHLARKLQKQGSNIPINAVHPGEVLTEVTREFPQPIPWLVTTFEPFVLMLMKSPVQGSQGNVFLCTSPTVHKADQCTGQYFMRLEKLGNCAAWNNPKECELAYNICCDLVGVDNA